MGKLLLERNLKDETNFLYAHITLAKAYIDLDQKEEAQAQAAEKLEINPNFLLGCWQK